MRNVILALLLPLQFTLCLAQSLVGKVSNAEGVPLPFSTVYLKKSNIGTTTDVNGNFKLSTLSIAEDSLVVTRIGYQKRQLAVNLFSPPNNLQIKLAQDINKLDAVTVFFDKQKQEIKRESLASISIKKEFLHSNSSGSLMQTLAKIPGINFINIGSSASKPIIRGMSFSRVAVINNGLKLEGQQWGETHGLEIDQYSIENITLIKGPASLQYGSDAIAGVINILSPAIPKKDLVQGEVMLLSESNSNLYGASAQAKARKGRVFFTIRGTYLNHADFKVPVDSIEYNTYNLKLNGFVKNSSGRELGIKTKSGYIFKNGISAFEISNFYRKSGFYADAHGVELRTQIPVNHAASIRDVKIPYQVVNHVRISNHSEFRYNQSKLYFNLGYQNNIHTDYDHLTDVTGKTSEFPDNHLSTSLKLHTLSGNLTLARPIGSTRLKLGTATQYISNTRGGFNFNIPDYNRMVSGVFLHSQTKLKQCYFINAGIRYDYGKTAVDGYINPRNQNSKDSILSIAYDRYYNSITGMFGISALLKDLQVKLNAGKGFRIPSIRETSAFGMIWSSARYEIGNRELNPEESYQLDISLDYSKNNLTAMIAGFYSYFTNYIFPNPTGEFNTISGAGQIYEYIEAQALRYGGEFSLSYSWFKTIDFNCNGEYVVAQNLANQGPLPFTPPFSADASVKVMPIKNRQSTNFSLGVKYISEQTRVAQNEVPNYCTPAATILYCALNYTFNNKASSPKVVFRIDNLLNTEYYHHVCIYRRLNIPEPGRNIQLKLIVPIGYPKSHIQ